MRGGSCESSGDWCTDDNDCSDGVFCNGAEMCGDNGTCYPGILIDCGDEYCNEAMGMCAACVENWHCADGFGCVEGECVEDTPPAITTGPFLASGPWPLFSTSESKAFTLNQNYYVLWTFDDDYATCEGLCTNRARYRRLDGTQWFELQAEADATGTWYAYAELKVNNMRDGTYLFQVETVDCAGQLKTSRSYYFKVQH